LTDKKDGNEMTTIGVRIRTRLRLQDVGKKNETYDDIVNRLVDAFLVE